MEFPYGETVRLVRAGLVEDPFSGELVADWSNPTYYPLPVPCAVYASMVAEPGVLETPLLVTSTLTVVMPYETDVRQTDRVQIMTGSFARIYEVEAVRKWKHPMTGWTPGAEVRVKNGYIPG